MKKFLYFLVVLFICSLAVLIIKEPQICANATANGLLLCARVIIPSLYPFTFCVLFILNSGALSSIKFADRFCKKVFGMPSQLFCIFILSLIGGYPLGAKLINNTVKDPYTARTMLNFCVNAGPAFIITSVGVWIFGSQKIGILLFVTHIIPSFLMAFMNRKQLRLATGDTKKALDSVDNFIASATAAAEALINICGYVLLFSIICAYINKYSFLKPLNMLLEVTNGINSTRNILTISFLLGFGGICIWCQVFSVAKKAKPQILKFALYRIFHGLLSSVLTYIGIKLFKISITTLSNGMIFSYGTFTNTAAVGVSLITMSIVFIISLRNKNFAGNILEDVV